MSTPICSNVSPPPPAIAYYLFSDQTNRPHLGSGRLGGVKVFPRRSVIQTVGPPLNSLQVLHQPPSNRSGPLGPQRRTDRADWRRSRAALRWPVGLCFPALCNVFGTRYRYGPFLRESGEEERNGGGMKGEREKRKMRNYLCPCAIT